MPAGVPVMGGGEVTEVPPPPPPQAGTSTTPVIKPRKARLLALLLSGFAKPTSNIKSATREVVRTDAGPLPPDGQLTDPEVGAGCELECAVVEMVSVTTVGVVPLTLTDAEGEKVQVAAAGTPVVQANDTFPLKPFTDEALRL